MNMVVLIGRLVRDPSYSEVETEKGKYHIASFYLAVPRNFNKGVNYIKITTFGKQADFARDFLTKGKRVAILGELMIGMEDRQKVLYISKKMKEERQETIKRVTSDYGTQLRMNRSIQAEGSFANIKEDMEFRRYLYRGKANVTAQSILLAIGYNINKLHHKIQAGRTGRHLFPLKQTA